MADDGAERTTGEGAHAAPGSELERVRALAGSLAETSEQLETVNRIVSAVNSGRSIEEVFELATEQIRALVPFDRASLALCEDGGTLRVYALTGERAGSLAVGARGHLRGSVTELALTERRTVAIPELREESRFNAYADLRREGFRSAVCVPLFSMRRAVGSLNLTSRARDAYGRSHLLALERLAAPLAIAIEKTQLLEASWARNEELRHLYELTQAQAEREAVVNRLLLSLQRGTEPREKVRAAIERVGQALELDRCVAVLFADEEHEDYYGEWCAEGVEPVTSWPEVRRRSPIRHALRDTRRPLVVADVRRHPLFQGLGELVERARLKSLLVVPVTHLGHVVGSISAHQTRHGREWSEDDVELLTAVATHLGATLENASLISELRRANRAKDEFLATLSRELRSPLAAINTSVETLDAGGAVARDAGHAEALGALRASAASLTRLVSDLLDEGREP